MKKAGELDIRGTVVRVVKIDGEDFVCLTGFNPFGFEGFERLTERAKR